MKGKKRVKPLKSPLDLSRSPLHFAPTGLIVPVVQRGRAHPGVEGRLAGEARMKKNPPHAGEMHPDGDELLYLVDGAVEAVPPSWKFASISAVSYPTTILHFRQSRYSFDHAAPRCREGYEAMPDVLEVQERCLEE